MSQTPTTRILVIDDDEMTLTIVRKMLESEGLAVDSVVSAREGLAMVAKTSYEAIVCDMWMPGMTGSEFYRTLKDQFPEYRSRVIFLTGDLASEATWEFIDQRRLPYVLKPFSVADLRKKLEEVMGDLKLSPPPPPPPPGSTRRRHRRVAMRANVRVRKKKWATGGPDIAAVSNASKGGVYFLSNQDYRVGTEVWVAFPFTGVNDVEQEGCVVRVDKRPDGKFGIAMALGEAAAARRGTLAGSEEDRRRQKILAMADMSAQAPNIDVVAEQVADSAELKAKIVAEREEARRLAEELADLKATYEHVGSQRDRLADEEKLLKAQLAELEKAKQSMSEVVEDLKGEMETLQQQLAAAEKFRFQATHDSLTSLWNRAAILDILKRELARARRESDPVGIIVADLDHFKSINDTYGHQAGDAVLQEAAQRMSKAVRDYDAVGRYGGEEFLIVLSGCDTESTLKQAERVRECLSGEEIVTAEGKLRVTASMGVVTSAEAKDPEALFRAADAALYRAKRGGRNCVVLATAADAAGGASSGSPEEGAPPSKPEVAPMRP